MRLVEVQVYFARSVGTASAYSRHGSATKRCAWSGATPSGHLECGPGHSLTRGNFEYADVFFATGVVSNGTKNNSVKWAEHFWRATETMTAMSDVCHQVMLTMKKGCESEKGTIETKSGVELMCEKLKRPLLRWGISHRPSWVCPLTT